MASASVRRLILNEIKSDFTRAHLHVRRLKGGIASVHPIQGDELRAVRYVAEPPGHLSLLANARVAAASKRAGLPYANPHMLRHTCGHLLADAGHDTRRLQLCLGHADIKHTAHYGELSAKPFKDFLEVKEQEWKRQC